MDMASQSSSMFALPKVMDDPRETSAKKKNPDDDYCLSFPSMLEQKQATGNEDRTLTKSSAENTDKMPSVLKQDTNPVLNSNGNSVNFKELNTEAKTSHETVAIPAGSISGFLQSLALVSTEAAVLATEDQMQDPVADNIVNNIVNKIVGAACETTKEVTNDKPVVAVPVKNDQSLLQTIINNKEKVIVSKEQVAIATGQSCDTAETSKSAAETIKVIAEIVSTEKSSFIMKDVVLASNKPTESTYSVPGKMAVDLTAEKAFPTTESLSILSKQTPGKLLINTPVTTGPEQAMESKEAEASEVITKTISMESMEVTGMENLSQTTGTDNQAQASAKPEAVEAQSETESSQDSFTVPVQMQSVETQASGSSSTSPLSSSITAEIRQQVVQHLASRMEGPIGNEKVTLYLNPEKLGQIEVQLTAKNDVLTVVLTVSEGQVEKAVQDSVRDLTESLLARGGRFQQVDVKIEAKSSQNERDQQRENDGKNKDSKDNKGNPQDHEHQPQDPSESAWNSAMQEG